MLGKKNKALTTDEIRAAAEKIREKYNDFIIQYMKPPEIKQGFEERYLYALRNRLDMARFFIAEKQALEELAREEDSKIQSSWNKAGEPEKPEPAGIADRIIEERETKVSQYPTIKIHSEASKELEHLFGALQVFEKEHWPNVQNMLRKYFRQFYTGARMGLESEIIELCCPNLDGMPPRLTSYAHLFERFPRDYSRIEKEEKLCLTETAVMLGKVQEEITRIFSLESLEDDEKGLVAGASNYVNDIISDFRLKDLAKLHKGVNNGFRNNQ